MAQQQQQQAELPEEDTTEYTTTLLELVPKVSVKGTEMYCPEHWSSARHCLSSGSLTSTVTTTYYRNVMDFIANDNLQTWFKDEVFYKQRFLTKDLCKVRLANAAPPRQ